MITAMQKLGFTSNVSISIWYGMMYDIVCMVSHGVVGDNVMCCTALRVLYIQSHYYSVFVCSVYIISCFSVFYRQQSKTASSQLILQM